MIAKIKIKNVFKLTKKVLFWLKFSHVLFNRDISSVSIFKAAVNEFNSSVFNSYASAFNNKRGSAL